MGIAASEIIQRASVLLTDRAKRTWPAETLLQWLSDGQLAIVQLRPDAYTAVRLVVLAPGTRQTVPADDLQLLDVPRNMGSDGVTPGFACRYIDRKQLDLSNPNWHAATASPVVLHWMYDQATPKTWWCYPPQPATGQGKVEMDVSAVPPKLTAATDELALDDIWLNPLLQFTVYRAFSEDNEYTQAGGKADLAQREFLQSLGIKVNTDRQFNPSRNQPPRFESPPKSDSQGAFG